MSDDEVALHREAIEIADEWVARVTDGDLGRDSPCIGWTLADLLAHMVGQHLGFMQAVRDGDAPVGAYAPVPFTPEAWRESVEAILAAFADADPERPVLEVELFAISPLPFGVVVRAQLLDTVIHTWDIATSLGLDFTPPDHLVEIVAQMSEALPDSAFGEGRAFGARLDARGSRWEQALLLSGRETR